MQPFSCSDCKSPEIRLPRELQADAKVYCGGCGKQLATWREYRSLVGKLLATQSTGALSCDPVE